MFSVRIVTANHYQAQPIRDLDVTYSDFRGSEVKQVPVLRIFGATPVGQKTCLHIHGVFPYIYVGCGPQEFMTDKDMRQFATSIDLAMQVAMGKTSGNTQYVFKVVSVQAVPMYGYHSRSRRFLKVYFYNPLMVKRAVELLQSGAVLNKVFQPHEAHIPFILQFCMDYNLYGMNLIHLAAVKFRREKVPNDTDTESSPDIQPVNLSSMLNSSTISTQRWNRNNIPSGLLLDAEIQKQSVCELEVDAVATDILNRHELQGNTEMNPGLLAIYNEEKERREMKGQLDDLHPPTSPGRGVIEDTDTEVKGKARLADIIQKQLSELRALAGGEDDDDDDDSVLQDTLAESSLTASQLLLHDSQYAGDEDSVASPEDEESQPVINEEVVQSLVEASQRCSRYSQQAVEEEDQDLVQLLVGLAQDDASPEDGSILSSQQTQDDARKQELLDGEQDEDAKESLEMSQAWQEDSDDEAERSHTIHDISASEEDSPGSQAIPQFDGGSDDKPATAKKKTLGMKHQFQKFTPNSFADAMDGSSTSFNPFPPEIKTYANKKLLLNSPEKTTDLGSATFTRFNAQKTVVQHIGNSTEDRCNQATEAKVQTSPYTESLHEIPLHPTKVGSAVLSKATLQTKPDGVTSGAVGQDRASLEVDALDRSSKSDSSEGHLIVQDEAPMKSNPTQVVAQGKHSSKWDSTKPASQDHSSLKNVSSKVVPQDKTILKWHSSQLFQDRRIGVSSKEVSDKATSNRNPISATKSVATGSPAPELIKVPSTSDTVHLARCRELKDFASLDQVKKDPSWNPVLMLIKCPIQTDSRGKIRFSGTSLPRKQLEQIRRDKLKAQPCRRSSFSRKIVPPKKFMDEQYWMDQILKLSKKKTEDFASVDDTHLHKFNSGLTTKGKHRRPRKQNEGIEGQIKEKVGPDVNTADALKNTIEPPCLLSPVFLEVVKPVKGKHHMPILEKMTSPNDARVTQHSEKQTVITKTKATQQEKYFKSSSSPDKKSKLSRSASSKKIHAKTDAKRYKMLSSTFNKLSLSTQESSEGTTQPTLNTGVKLSTTKTDSSFVSSVPTSSQNNGSRNDTGHSSSENSVFSPYTSSSTHPVPQETTQQIMKRSPGGKKRRGSDSSDEWASQKPPGHKRKSGQDCHSEKLIFGKSYRFRKRERISYDDGDFPDVGFDIMCWSDQEDAEDAFSQILHEQHQTQSVELQSGPRPRPQKELQPQLHPVESSTKQCNSIHSSHQTKGATFELPLSPPRKRGRPLGSKNKSSKFLKSGPHFPTAGDSKSSPSSRSKPHLSFTVDHMLRNGASVSQIEPESSGSSEPVSVTTTSHSSLGGPSASSTTVTQATFNMDQPTVNHSHAYFYMTERHGARSRTQEPIHTAVNGHHSNDHGDLNEPALYRDAMWNLGYFSPRRKEKEVSPPRCWSPSGEVEWSTRFQQTSEMSIETKQNHKPSKVQEQGKRSNITERKQGHIKKKKIAVHSWSINRDEKSHSRSVREENQTSFIKPLMTSSNSKTSNKGPESKHSCNLDIFDKGSPLKTNISKLSKHQENRMELEEQEPEDKNGTQKEAVSFEDGKHDIKASCTEVVTDGFSLHTNLPYTLAKETHNSKMVSQRITVDKDINMTVDVLSSSVESTRDEPETANFNTSPGMETKKEACINIAPKSGKQDRNKALLASTLTSNNTRLANRQKQMETCSLKAPTHEGKDQNTKNKCKDQTSSAHDSAHDMRLGLEFKGQSRSTMDDACISDASVPKVTLLSQTSTQRLNGAPVTLTEKHPDTQTASPNKETRKGPSSSCPESLKPLFKEGHSDDDMICSENQAMESQEMHSDISASTSVYLDRNISDSDVHFSPMGTDASSKCSSETQAQHKHLPQDRKAFDGWASPVDLDGSLDLSSDDITPAQRRNNSPIEDEDEDEDEDEESNGVCDVSRSSSSTGASLSLDMSLIISHVPSISPTRDMCAVDLEGRSLSEEQSQGHHGSQELFRENMMQDHQETDHEASAVSDPGDQLAQSRKHPKVLGTTCETHSSQSQSDYELTGEVSLTSTMTSGNHAGGSSGSDEFDQNLGGNSPCPRGTDRNSLLAQGSDQSKHGSKSDSNGDGSDTFSQLVCPETPSPKCPNDDALSGHSQQKPDSQIDELTSSCKQSHVKDDSNTPGSDLKHNLQLQASPNSKTGLADEKSLTIGSIITNYDEPLILVAETKKEPAPKSDVPNFPVCGEVIDSDDDVEAMEIDTSQGESENRDDSQQTSSAELSLEQSRHRSESRNTSIAQEAIDETSIPVNSGRSSTSSLEDNPVESGKASDSGGRERITLDARVVPNHGDKMSTLQSCGDQATEIALEQDAQSSARSRSVSPLGVHPSQAAETLDEVQQSELNETHPPQGKMDARGGSVHQAASIQPQTPVASFLQVRTQNEYSTQSVSQKVATPSMMASSSKRECNVWTPVECPPSPDMVKASLHEFGLPQIQHQRAFFGKPDDNQQSSKCGVHDDSHLQSNLPSHLPEAESRLSQTGLSQWQANMMALKPHPLLSPSVVAPESGLKAALVGDSNAVITPCRSPPSITQVQGWLNKKHDKGAQDKKDEKVINGKDDDDKQEEIYMLNLADKPSTPKVEIKADTEIHSNTTLEGGQIIVSTPRTSHQLQDKSSTSVGKMPKVILHRLQMNSTPSSKPVSTPQSAVFPIPSYENSNQAKADTPRVNPFTRRGGSQPQHSTPLKINTREEGGFPVTPISGWKQPTDPPSAGRSGERPSSLSSMRQTLLFTPTESSGAGRRGGEMSQIEGATPSNTCGFKMPQLNMQDAKTMHEVQHLTLMSMELHIKTRREYHPDPDSDPIRALFYSIQRDTPPQTSTTRPGCSHQQNDVIHGMIIVEDSNHSNAGPSTSSCTHASPVHSGISNIHTTSVPNENELLDELLSVVRRHDPDILVGYEVQQQSWGYLLQRAAFLDVDLCTQISRLPELKKESSFSAERDAYGADHQSEINIAGRITLNLWRLMRHEVALTNYTFENVAFHVLHQRIPQFTYRKLTDWFDHRNPQLNRWRVIEYYSVRVRGSLKLLHQLDLIGRTSELARVFGILFYAVLARGSQFRVESMMLRTAKPQNYVAMSPSVQQRSRMKAAECIPLVMEPESRFYRDPVIVLDFQSLYPTMMIAYNYCYSTCLGRLEHIANGGEYIFGCGSLSIPSSQLKKLLQSDNLHVSPNGIVFVKPSVRRGVLPTMLEQLLKLRVIVKKAMKDFKEDKTLRRMLDSRQLALKMIANFTYGYTSANFSGRMPCIEVGDSVVRKGRETLERSIHMVETTKKWGARVVYGDTDSMFVLVKGATKERAFEVGREIRDAVTAANPKPVKLKFEKVYHPCVLQSKKRYVGYSYESPDQVEPDFDAKGIETVRRDSCPAVGKILERALKVLFTTRDVSRVKQYVQKQFQKILDGQATMQDLIFAKEYRGSHTYRPGACVPALEISRRLLAVDRRAEPRVGQRVPYVIVHGSPGLPLIQLVRMPSQVLQDPSLRLNTTYYLTRQLVPSLNRVFGILGVDTMQWYQELPRWHRITAHHQPGTPGKKGTISQYFVSLNCIICEKVTKDSLCSECKAKGQVTATALMSRVQQWQLVQQDMAKICTSCCSFSEQDTNSCVSLDCPIMFKTNKLSRQLGQVPHYLQILDGL